VQAGREGGALGAEEEREKGQGVQVLLSPKTTSTPSWRKLEAPKGPAADAGGKGKKGKKGQASRTADEEAKSWTGSWRSWRSPGPKAGRRL